MSRPVAFVVTIALFVAGLTLLVYGANHLFDHPPSPDAFVRALVLMSIGGFMTVCATYVLVIAYEHRRTPVYVPADN